MSSIQGFSGGGGLLGAPIPVSDWVDTPAPVVAPIARRRRVAALGASGSSAILSLAVVKLAYYWPILQANLSVQFTCIQ